MPELPLRRHLHLSDLPLRKPQVTTRGMSPSPNHQMAASSFNTLLEHRNQFLGFVQRRVQDAATAEDILQAAYIRALQHEGELQDHESVVGWFYRVLRNSVIDLYRRRASESKALEEWGREMEGQSIPSHEIQNEICACLSRVMDTINPAYAEVLRSVDLGDQRLLEFAEEHDISPANAAVRVHRARAAFRKHLVRTCGTCAEHGCMDCNCRKR